MYFFFEGPYFGPVTDRSNVIQLRVHQRGAPEPVSIFHNFRNMLRQLEKCLHDHILPRHIYRSLNDRKKYMSFNNKCLMSVFDDTFTEQIIRSHIVQAMKKPTYIVQNLTYFDTDSGFFRPQYIIKKRYLKYFLLIVHWNIVTITFSTNTLQYYFVTARFDYQIGYDAWDDPTSILRVITRWKYDKEINQVVSMFVTAYPVRQSAENLTECKYIFVVNSNVLNLKYVSYFKF